MATPFQIAWSFLKAETPGRDAMMQEMSNNITKPDKYGNTRQMKRTARWGDASAALAGKLVNAQERMRTGDINDPTEQINFRDEDYPNEEYDMRPTEEREPFDRLIGNDDTGQVENIGMGPEIDPSGEREKLRALASQLGMEHKDVPYPVPPEMLQQMQMMNQG